MQTEREEPMQVLAWLRAGRSEGHLTNRDELGQEGVVRDTELSVLVSPGRAALVVESKPICAD